MSGSYLLDTNIVIALFAGEIPVLDHLRTTSEIYIPSTVIGELYYGAHKSAHTDENLRRIDDFAASSTVLNCDAVTAYHYGKVKNDLRQIGKPVPENDLWIAAIGIQYNITLVSRDEHFKNVNALTVEVW